MYRYLTYGLARQEFSCTSSAIWADQSGLPQNTLVVDVGFMQCGCLSITPKMKSGADQLCDLISSRSAFVIVQLVKWIVQLVKWIVQLVKWIVQLSVLIIEETQ